MPQWPLCCAKMKSACGKADCTLNELLVRCVGVFLALSSNLGSALQTIFKINDNYTCLLRMLDIFVRNQEG